MVERKDIQKLAFEAAASGQHHLAAALGSLSIAMAEGTLGGMAHIMNDYNHKRAFRSEVGEISNPSNN